VANTAMIDGQLVNRPGLSAKRSLAASQQTPVLLATSDDGDGLRNLAVDDANVYFIDYDKVSAKGHVWSVPKTGGALQSFELIGGVPVQLLVDSTSAYVMMANEGGTDLIESVHLDGSSSKFFVQPGVDGLNFAAMAQTSTAIFYTLDVAFGSPPPPHEAVRKKCKR
jgi:hypothetical protein